MEDELLNWKERIDNLKKKGDSFTIPGHLNVQTIYSAIRDNAELFKNRKFSIRTHPVTLVRHVMRTK